MIAPEDRESLSRNLFQLRIIVTAMAGGIVMASIAIVVLLAAVNPPAKPAFSTPPESLRLALFLAAAMLAALSVWLRGAILSDRALKDAAAGGFTSLWAAMSPRMVAVFALCEGVGMMGVALFVLFHQQTDLVFLALCSLACFFRCWPRRDEVESQVERLLAGP